MPAVENEKRVAFTDDALGFDLDPAVSRALDAAAEALTDAGYTVERVTPPMVKEIAEIGFRCLYGEMKLLMDADIRRLGSETVNKIFDSVLREFPPLEGEELLRAMAKRTYYARAWAEFQQTYPLTLTPFLFKPTFANDADIPGNAPFADVLGAAHYSFAFNYWVSLPASSPPTSTTAYPSASRSWPGAGVKTWPSTQLRPSRCASASWPMRCGKGGVSASDDGSLNGPWLES